MNALSVFLMGLLVLMIGAGNDSRTLKRAGVTIMTLAILVSLKT